MNRSILTHGACVMFGLLCGALIAFQLPADEPVAPASPDVPACGEYRVEFNGNPENWAFVRGCMGPDGVVTWYPDEQSFSVGPEDGRRDRPVEHRDADRWVVVQVNGRPVTMRGWKSAGGSSRWRVDGQRTHALQAGERPAGGPRPVKSGVVLPSGFEPKQDPQTGALLMGVDAKGLARDGEQLRASDPETKAEAEDVKNFYAKAPDASAKAVARNLPPVVSPNTWAAIFGYDLPTALTRIGAVGLLGGAALLIHRRVSGAA